MGGSDHHAPRRRSIRVSRMSHSMLPLWKGQIFSPEDICAGADALLKLIGTWLPRANVNVEEGAQQKPIKVGHSSASETLANPPCATLWPVLTPVAWAPSLGERRGCLVYPGLQHEKACVEQVFGNAMAALSESDRHLPQVENILPLLRRGIGIHHGGLLPILKEVVEILFQAELLKVLFSTETFSMGLNMPCRCTIFTDVKKCQTHSRKHSAALEGAILAHFFWPTILQHPLTLSLSLSPISVLRGR